MAVAAEDPAVHAGRGQVLSEGVPGHADATPIRTLHEGGILLAPAAGMVLHESEARRA